mgnify:CR=1 FL=1
MGSDRIVKLDTAVPFGRPWISEEDRQGVLDVLHGNILTHGPQGKAFEAAFTEFMGPGAHAVSVSSCMAALHLSYLQFGIGAGDDVIVPAMTHTATAHAVELVGARPVFVDPDPETGNLTADGITEALTPNTKAISVVHFLGIPCDMVSIKEVAQSRGLRIVEDCALAVGARFRGTHVGLFGDTGCFSFYPVKHLTTGEGGMLVTGSAQVAEDVSRLRGFGVDRSHGERTLPGMYDVPVLGLNYRMSELQASLGRTQMLRMHDNLQKRASNFRSLKAGIAGLPNVRVLDASSAEHSSSHYCLTFVLEGSLGAHRNELITVLKEAGIGTSVYYPHPVPRLRYYAEKYGYDDARYPTASEISDCSIALPVGPHVEAGDIDAIAQVVTASIRKLI